VRALAPDAPDAKTVLRQAQEGLAMGEVSATTGTTARPSEKAVAVSERRGDGKTGCITVRRVRPEIATTA
jgi:hypothetical protein